MIVRRFKIKNYAVGPQTRKWQFIQLSGITTVDANNFVDLTLHCGPQSTTGSLYQVPVDTPTTIISGGYTYSLDYLERKYQKTKNEQIREKYREMDKAEVLALMI